MVNGLEFKVLFIILLCFLIHSCTGKDEHVNLIKEIINNPNEYSKIINKSHVIEHPNLRKLYPLNIDDVIISLCKDYEVNKNSKITANEVFMDGQKCIDYTVHGNGEGALTFLFIIGNDVDTLYVIQPLIEFLKYYD